MERTLEEGQEKVRQTTAKLAEGEEQYAIVVERERQLAEALRELGDLEVPDNEVAELDAAVLEIRARPDRKPTPDPRMDLAAWFEWCRDQRETNGRRADALARHDRAASRIHVRIHLALLPDRPPVRAISQSLPHRFHRAGGRRSRAPPAGEDDDPDPDAGPADERSSR